MEIKAILNKPYTDEQKTDFIIQQNHNNGYDIKETEVALEAWGIDDAEKLDKAKQKKYAENEKIRDNFLISGVLYRNILWDSDIEQKLNLKVKTDSMNDTETVYWIAKDGVTGLECTKADLLLICDLLNAMTTYVWSIKNPQIKTEIANASTIEEVEAINIEYKLEEVII